MLTSTCAHHFLFLRLLDPLVNFQVGETAALGLPLWAYWPISHEILTPKDYSTARWVPQRGTQVSLSPVSR
jgi:hypothetical protein